MRRALLLSCAALLAASSPLRAQSCASAEGYPLRVHSAAGESLDSTFLTAVATSLAYRWQVPSTQRGAYAHWRRVSERVIPPEPRWADDWSPGPTHRARMLVTLFRNGRIKADRPDSLSGDDRFDRTLGSVASDPLPGAPRLPAFPPGIAADSLRLVVTFGDISAPTDAGVIRFAASQSPVRAVPGSIMIEAARTAQTSMSGSRRIEISYEVTEHGMVRPGSFQVLESSDRELADAVRRAMMTARFTPARSNCRPIALTVLQELRG